MCGVDQTDHAVLHQVADVDRMGHRRCHPSRQRFHKGQSRFDPFRLGGLHRLDVSVACPKAETMPELAGAEELHEAQPSNVSKRLICQALIR